MENKNNQSKLMKLKAIMLGDSRTGKTSIIQSIVNQEFFKDYSVRKDVFSLIYPQPTPGLDFAFKYTQFRGNEIRIELWEVTGGESFSAFVRHYNKEIESVSIVYDVSSKSITMQTENLSIILITGLIKHGKWRRKDSNISYWKQSRSG